MASRGGKPAYPFAAPNASTGSRGPQQRPPQGKPPSNLQLQPAAPPSLAHSGPQRRPGYPAPGISPANSPNASAASLLIPKGPQGSPSPAGRGQSAPPRANHLAPPRAPQLKSKNSDSSLASTAIAQSISDKYSLSADPSTWGAELSLNIPEPDDYLHNPDPKRDRKNDEGGTIFTKRGLANLGCLVILAVGLVALFAGYPLISYFTTVKLTTLGGYNLGGINRTGQVPTMTGNFGLIDVDTPQDAYTKRSYTHGEDWELVFSDEFNVDGRTFYAGDDPYWEAVDLHYWGTNNMEWYDPEAVTTKDGSLVITLSRKDIHELDYMGGMVSTWNKFCFTGGLIEINAVLPGASDVWGLWPAVWTMGNLGRAGYGASLDGMWPYSYDSCDVGTLPNQTMPDGTPDVALTGGMDGQPLSYLPGQRLSACTCPGEPHPGPIRSDGSFAGRSAPEIDILEAQVSETTATGHLSQSAQWAPFNLYYVWDNVTNSEIYQSQYAINTYRGGWYQQTTSGVGEVDQTCYELKKGCFSIYGFEYQPGNDGFITWVSNGAASWGFKGPGMAGQEEVKIGPRPVSQEPMYIIANLGMSENFGAVDLRHLKFPTHFQIDYVRIYQPKDQINVGCDPEGYPTSEYINTYLEAYTNPNLTTWKQFGQSHPKNRLVDDC